MGEELDRLTSMFSTLLEQQRREMAEGIRSVGDAMRRAADRIAAQASMAAPTTPAGAVAASAASAATAGAATPAPSAGTGILAVRVVNDSGSPVPVTMTNAPQKEERGGFWGVVSGIAGGLGSLVGGLIGGFVGGGIGGAIFGAELIIAIAQLDGILKRFYSFANNLIFQIHRLIGFLFSQLTAAGIFPIARLFATLLVFIDLGVAVVLAHLRVVINWVREVVQTLAAWLGQFMNALSNWLTGLLNTLRVFVAAIVRDAIRSLVESVAALFLGSAFAIALGIKEAIVWGGRWFLNLVTEFLNKNVSSSIPVVAAPTADFLPSVRSGIESGMAAGRTLAETWTRGILGPAPGTSAKPPHGPGSVASGPTTPGKASPSTPSTPSTTPGLQVPGFKMPPLNLPEFPEITPQLENLLRPPATPPAPTPPSTRAVVPPPAEPIPNVILNGGVNVTIAAQTIDRDHADETGREIAGSLLEEMRRLAERDRFRLGLPTTATS